MTPPEVTQAAMAARISEALLTRAAGTTNLKAWRWRAAEALGCDPRTFEKLLYGEQMPSTVLLYRLFVYFGTDFKREIDAMIGYDTARIDDAQALREANLLARYRNMTTAIKGVIGDVESDDKAKLRAVK